MRCAECGKSNPENSKICGTCGTKLTDLKSSGVKSGNPIHRPLTDDTYDSGTPTLMGKPSNSHSWDEPLDYREIKKDSKFEKEFSLKSNIDTCPDCGHYPLYKENKQIICPNCEFLGGQKNEELNPNGYRIKSEPTQKIEGFTLPGEDNFSLTNLKTNQKIKFDLAEVVLNRTSLESENSSISRDKHAVISQINGKWYIQDLSTHQATYVQVIGQIPLVSGTVILMGNQFFKFD
ncbi:MAG: FHA domain-containing protein [Algoriphagus sp.]|uniref:FHA domain-containing protein n=1 Tax=Algoriphagus sp. TaxID=1872435 RepID=UPI002616EB50|nr:FHA domain-containing protein [Algoriphagus sp.]MDG1279303.1 FHA domain-containing protein [Algoriphagus sp.]